MSTWGQVIGILRRRMIGVSLDVSGRKNSETLIREKRDLPPIVRGRGAAT